MRQKDDAAIGRIAWTAVLLAHLVFAWLLTQATRVPPDAADPAIDDALQLVWIEAPLPATPPSTLRVIARARPPTPARAIPRQPAIAQAPDETTKVEPLALAITDIPPGLSAVFIEPRSQSDAGDDAATFIADPLAHRAAGLPGTPGERIRMREPMSVAKVARGIGQLFGGSAYTTDPCPQIRANLTNLVTGGENELRDEEQRRLKAYCL